MADREAPFKIILPGRSITHADVDAQMIRTEKGPAVLSPTKDGARSMSDAVMSMVPSVKTAKSWRAKPKRWKIDGTTFYGVMLTKKLAPSFWKTKE